MAILAAFVVFAAVFLFVVALAGSREPARSRLDLIRGRREGPSAETRPPSSASRRLMEPVVAALVRALSQLLPAGMIAKMEHRLVLAGEPMTRSAFLALRAVCAGFFLVLPVMIVIAGGLGFGLPALLLTGLFAVVGVVLPDMWVAQRIGQRQHQITKSLPDAFDLITTCVEAGLGLEAALTRVAEKVEGPFADELARSLHEISLGKARSAALKELADRTGVPDLVTFVNAVIQAERMGSSVGAVLRVQAEQLRTRRRQRAEEQAYKAPVKMIFPLVLCIFPTLFIVILGPAVITIMRDFPGR